MRIGMDIGSTTVKIVVLDSMGEIIYKQYDRHYAMVRQKAADMLRAALPHLPGTQAHLAITGSAGLGLARSADLPFVQEVFAAAGAVEARYPDADAAVELGGEDAKILFFSGGLEERMNGSCAGGTGAFIDQMATLLGVTVPELDTLAMAHEKIYAIASRCGVFAKTDIQPLLNQGARKEDLAASIYQAVVEQTVAGLAQGRKIEGKVLFLGGPLTFLQGLRGRFVETLGLDAEHAVFPEDGECFVAVGAALYAGKGKPLSIPAALAAMESAAQTVGPSSTLPPLFESQADLAAFRERHARADAKTLDPASYAGDAYLGIDAGSTTTKLALITPRGELLYTHYTSNSGNPVAVVREQLEVLHALCGDRIRIAGSAVTGYGEDLIQNAFHVDLGLVETVAHFGAARFFEPQVDFILDIGGQDMKCLKIRNAAIDGILLNEACSSGCGSFIETFARAMGTPIDEYARLGLLAPSPVDLGSRCTVFMNSSVKQAQKDGAAVADISAGLSYSIVKNAIHKVIRVHRASDLGRHIVVQGGTFLNEAVLRAFELELGADVVRPRIAGLMGAFGAALHARDAGLTSSTLMSAQGLSAFQHEVQAGTCKRCTNLCKLTINRFEGGRTFISGNRCERGAGAKQSASLPNLYRFKYDYLRGLSAEPGAGALPQTNGETRKTDPRGRIGIPMGLNMFENLPFWHAFFTHLGFDVVLSPESNRALYQKGQYSIPSDTVCYPAKLMHGHVEALLDMGVDTIFYPCLPYNFDEEKGDNHYNCPVVAYYPELLAANVKRLSEAAFLTPYFGLHRPADFEKRAAAFCREHWGIPRREVTAAARAAYAAYEAYHAAIEREGARIIAYARANGHPMIVLAGRPYHIDPEIHHGIDALLSSFGLCVLTEDAVAGNMPRQRVHVLNQWTYQSRLYQAAAYVCQQPDMQLVQLVSFGCGIDAITGDETREILERGGKLYTQLKIDEISNLGAVKIRIRSLLAADQARRSVAYGAATL